MEFLQKEDIIEIQADLINEFGGTHGIRDEGVLESALAAAVNRAYYEGADIIACAAAYAYHLTKAHAFLDGNKRVAAHALELFLDMNNTPLPIAVDNDQMIDFFLKIAATELSRDEVEAQLRAWIA